MLDAILFWGLSVYGLSVVGVVVMLYLEHKFAKYPDYYNFIGIMGLGLIPLLNTFLVLDTIRLAIVDVISNLWYVWKHRNDKVELTSRHVCDADSISMYPHQQLTKIDDTALGVNEYFSLGFDGVGIGKTNLKEMK